MIDRIIITLVIVGGLTLAWFVWQYYKARLIKTIPAAKAPTGKPTLLYFTGEYCAVCEYQQSPIVAYIATTLGTSVEVNTLDVSTHPDLASQYKVFTLPTTVVLDEQGQVAHINYGLTQQAKLETQLSVETDPNLNQAAEFRPESIISIGNL
jgi:thiol-disulfide isomerase/thioredoxin